MELPSARPAVPCGCLSGKEGRPSRVAASLVRKADMNSSPCSADGFRDIQPAFHRFAITGLVAHDLLSPLVFFSSDLRACFAPMSLFLFAWLLFLPALVHMTDNDLLILFRC